MLNPQELKKLSQVSGARTSLTLLGDVAGIALVLAAVAHWLWLWPLGFLLIGRSQLALAILMHDGAHKRLYRSQALNDWLGQFLLAAPLLFSMDSYRKLHLKHHLDPLVADDPDLSLTGGYPIPRASLRRKLLRDITGLSYFKFIRYFIYMARVKKSAAPKAQPAGGGARGPHGVPKSWVLASILLAQALILGALWAAGHPWLYLTLWLVPAMTILQVLLRIRGIAEHAGYAPNRDQRLNARTVVNPLQTFFLAPHGVHYHIEHHVYPSVPFYRLAEVHRLMKERGMIPEKNFYTSYVQVVAELVR